MESTRKMNKYEVIFDDEYKDEETAKIRILDGKYKDIVYHYNYVSFNEEHKKLQFEYDIDETPKDIELSDLTEDDSWSYKSKKKEKDPFGEFTTMFKGL